MQQKTQSTKADVWSNYPCLAQCLPKEVRAEIQQLAAAQPGTVEIEVRANTWLAQKQQMISGISKEQCLFVLNKLDNNNWFDVTDWEMSHDCFYTDASGQELRTTTHFNEQMPVSHVFKKLLFRKTLTLEDKSTTATTATQNTQTLQASQSSAPPQLLPCIRLAVSSESPVPTTELPNAIQAIKWIRIKLRKSYWYPKRPTSSHGQAHSQPYRFRFDVTQSWDGPSRSIAERKQVTGTGTRYELECELVNTANNNNNAATIDGELLSLMLKIIDLFPAFHGKSLYQASNIKMSSV